MFPTPNAFVLASSVWASWRSIDVWTEKFRRDLQATNIGRTNANSCHLSDFLDQRRAARFDELELVDEALAKAQRSPELDEWLEKLEKWRDELRAVVIAVPNAPADF
jgi:hypothetical protein